MSVISTSTRNTLGLSASAPSSVTSYNHDVLFMGFPVTYRVIDGTDGSDAIAGAPTTSYIFGNGGNDTLSNDGSAAILIGGSGADVFKMYNNSSLAGIVDGNVLDFEMGSDRIDLSHLSLSYNDLLITRTNDASAIVEHASSDLKILIAAVSGLSTLNSSSFILSGDSTTPETTDGGTVNGNASDNSLFGTLLSNIINGLAGNDTIYGGDSAASPTDLADTIAGGAGDDVVYGNGGNDVLYGGTGIADPSDGNDLMYGGLGADSLYGNSGNDSLYGGGSNADPTDLADLVYGGIGADFILGNGGSDSLYGGGSIADPGDQGDTIYGGVGDDTIYGNGGNDILYGQDGNDYLHGGVGDDIYAFSGSTGSDTIAYFEGEGSAGGDVIQIAAGTGGLSSVAQILAAISYQNGYAMINLGSGNSITVLDIAANAFIESDFTIV